MVLNAVVGFAGLGVTVAALEPGRRLALANKESLDRRRAGGAARPARRPGPSSSRSTPSTAPSTSALPAVAPRRWRELVLTASGGPFRGRTADELASVTVADALAHPTWQMGPKITIDSSTLMNKGLEVIEAHELFGIDYDQIEVVVHPQSIVHSMVEFCDGATIAQLSVPDMRLPIGYALGYPDRLAEPYGSLDFATPRSSRVRAAGPRDVPLPPASPTRPGAPAGSAPAWLNAANEVAVAAFLDGRLAWPAIAEVVAETLDAPRADGSGARWRTCWRPTRSPGCGPRAPSSVASGRPDTHRRADEARDLS